MNDEKDLVGDDAHGGRSDLGTSQEGQLSHDALADAKQANGDTYRRILASWQEYDACLRKISAVCWTDNDAFDERDCTANIIRHIRDLQRRVKQIETGNQTSPSEIGSVRSAAQKASPSDQTP